MSFRFEKYTYANSTEDVARYTLKYGRVNGVYEDEEVAYDLKRTASAMLRDGVPPKQVVEETSALYDIPEKCVEEVVAAEVADCELPQVFCEEKGGERD